MDKYTFQTREWLNRRFGSADDSGFYKPHAPVYGFVMEPWSLGIYKNNYAILKAIADLSQRHHFKTCLEVGCAEGFTAALIRDLFGCDTSVCDLSGEAVRRAEELYGLHGFAADAQSLTMVENGAYDLVVCSETLEHIPEPQKAFAELLRVTGKVLILTVPAANSRAEKKAYIPPPVPHTHLHVFTAGELTGLAAKTKISGISSRWAERIESLFLENAAPDLSGKPWLVRAVYQLLRLSLTPVRSTAGKKAARFLILLDSFFCRQRSRVNTFMAVSEKAAPDVPGAGQKPLPDILEFMFGRSQEPLRL